MSCPTHGSTKRRDSRAGGCDDASRIRVANAQDADRRRASRLWLDSRAVPRRAPHSADGRRRRRGVRNAQRPGRLRALRRRPTAGHRRGEEAQPGPAKRADPGRALRQGGGRQRPLVGRISCPLPLRHERRSDLVPRRAAAARAVAADRRVSHAGGARRAFGLRHRRRLSAARGLAEQSSALARLSDRGERGRRRGDRRVQAHHARGHGHRHRQDLHHGEPGLPADEVGRSSADSVPR